MHSFKTVISLGIILISISFGCTPNTAQSVRERSFVQNFIEQPLDLVEPEANKLWEGEIGDKWVGYYRLKDNSHYKDVVVVTQDKLPHTFRRIEYCDRDGDSSLDIISIKMYHIDQGWQNLRITQNNETTLRHANNTYKEMLHKIRNQRLKQINY